jgi:hypothetical protein
MCIVINSSTMTPPPPPHTYSHLTQCGRAMAVKLQSQVQILIPTCTRGIMETRGRTLWIRINTGKVWKGVSEALHRWESTGLLSTLPLIAALVHSAKRTNEVIFPRQCLKESGEIITCHTSAEETRPRSEKGNCEAHQADGTCVVPVDLHPLLNDGCGGCRRSLIHHSQALLQPLAAGQDLLLLLLHLNRPFGHNRLYSG